MTLSELICKLPAINLLHSIGVILRLGVFESLDWLDACSLNHRIKVPKFEETCFISNVQVETLFYYVYFLVIHLLRCLTLGHKRIRSFILNPLLVSLTIDYHFKDFIIRRVWPKRKTMGLELFEVDLHDVLE